MGDTKIQYKNDVPLSSLPSPILIVGPAFSGKSSLAQQVLGPIEPTTVIGTSLIAKHEAPALYARINKLKAMRPGGWTTIEQTQDVAAVAQAAIKSEQHLLIDSISQWLASCLLTAMEPAATRSEDYLIEGLAQRVQELLNILTNVKDQRIVLVSAELGSGPSPERLSERILRMAVGDANVSLAAFARTVVDVRCGIPTIIKKQ